jgi:ATP-dependent helicase HrpA
VRDAELAAELRPLWAACLQRAAEHRDRWIFDPELEQYRWMLEELRVSLFAQELKTSIPVSFQRLERQWAKVRS